MTGGLPQIYSDNPAINAKMSMSTFRKMKKKVFREYRPPACESDYCQYCFDFDKKVLPEWHRVKAAAKEQLQDIMPNYFKDFDDFVVSRDLVSQPGAEAELLLHYIDRHREKGRCKECKDDSAHRSAFPCGLLVLRQRGSGFPQTSRIRLGIGETKVLAKLRPVVHLVQAYVHHRESNDQQSAALSKLASVDGLVQGHVLVHSDWKELETLPIMPTATGEMFYATARKQISVFGSFIMEHARDSTPASPKLKETYLIILTDILDHTCLISNMFVDRVIQLKSDRPMSGLHIISDAGPHFRGYENLYHNCVTLVQKYDCEVFTHWGCEKHMKGRVDRLFGWFRGWLKSWVANRKAIVEIEDMKAACMAGVEASRQRNPEFPKVVIHISDPVKPTTMKLLKPSGFLIRRSYCLSSSPCSASSYGVKVFNHLYSDKPMSIHLHDLNVSTATPENLDWRRGMYTEGRNNWDTDPVSAMGKETELTRRFADQKRGAKQRGWRRHGLPSLDSQIAKAKRRLENQTHRNTVKLAAQKAAAASPPSSPSSSTSSSSSGSES